MENNQVNNKLEWCKQIEFICQELEWKTSIQNLDEHLMIICPLANDGNFSGVLFVISDDTSRLMMSVSFRTKVSQAFRTKICESISRMNFGLLAGCVELDLDQGEVRYRDGLFLFNMEANPEILKAFVATTLRDAQIYYSEIGTIVSRYTLSQSG